MKPRSAQRTVFADQWDRDELDAALASSPELAAARKLLGRAVPTGAPALADLFFVLLKAAPRLVSEAELDPGYLVNRAVMGLFMSLPATDELRCLTVGDPLQTTLACVSAEKGLEELFARLKDQVRLAAQLAQLYRALARAQGKADAARQALDAAAGQLAEATRLGRATARLERKVTALSGRLTDAAAVAAALEADLAGQVAQLQANVEADRHKLAVVATRAAETATSQATARARTAVAWGSGPGTWQRLPLHERFELARRLDTPALRHAAELFGRLQPVVAARLGGELDSAAAGELYELGQGADLGRLAGEELVALNDPVAYTGFLRRYYEGTLSQYDVHEDTSRARGAVVLCVDRSSSMVGRRELFATALTLALLSVAQEQGRTMHFVPFGSSTECGHFVLSAGCFDLADVVRAAEVSFGGGTDFVAPMSYALTLLDSEHSLLGAADADVVFVTDDECAVDDDFMAYYLDEMRRMGARTWGVGASEQHPRPDGALGRMSEGRLWHVSEFLGP